MSVKLSRYIFRRINGRIIPIRKGIQQAEKIVSELADEVLKAKRSVRTGEPSKKALLGRGVDFNVFALKNNLVNVLKVPRNTVGTQNKTLVKHFPELKDKIAVSKAASDNLPNYGIPTVEQKVVRIKGKLKGILQDRVFPYEHVSQWDRNSQKKAYNAVEFYKGQAERLSRETGLHLDAHYGNFSDKGELIDTGLNLKKVNLATLKRNDMAREILGIETNWGTSVKEAGKPEMLTDQALEYGHSRKALKKLNALLKSGKVKLDKKLNPKLIPESSSTDDMIDYMKKTGNIRIHHGGDSLNVDTYKNPTLKQIRALEDMSEGVNTFYYDTPRGSGELSSLDRLTSKLSYLPDPKKSKLADRLEQKALDEFGTTYNSGTAGYITREGDLLDFSGGRGSGGIRGEDHRAIAEIMPNRPLKKLSDEAANEIIGRVAREGKQQRARLHAANSIYQDILKWKSVKKGDPLYELKGEEIKHLHGLLKGDKFSMRHGNIKNSEKFLKKLKGK